MKKSKFLTLFGVMLAMGITACSGTTTPSESKPSTESSSQPQPSKSSSDGGSKSSSTSSSSTPAPSPDADPEGHKFGADVDVPAGDGTVAYKKATCEDNDGAIRLKVNQSVVTYASGSSRKSGTPEGYTKLTNNNQSFSFKFEVDKNYTGNLYFFGCMDGWSTDGNREAGFYRQGTPSAKVEINGVALDASAQQNKKYRDYFGEEQIDTELSSPSDHLSVDGYAPFAPVLLKKGVNEVKYTRVQTQNMLIKDFVFIVQEAQEWGPAQDVAANAEAGTVAYKKYANNFDGTIKLEVALDDSMLVGSSVNKNDPAGYFKLKNNNDSFAFKFSYDSIAYGDIYQRGVMDGWSSNKGKKLFSGGSNGADDFEMKVNNEKVNIYPSQKALSFEQAMPGEAQDGDLSPLTDVLTGPVQLANGVNEFSYKRTASYNLALTHIVFIVKNSDHVHAAGENATWAKDANYHWHVCANEGCNEIVDKAEHTWVADESKTDVASTETEHGKHFVKCSVCGQEAEQELPLAGHTWGAAETKIGNLTPHTCTVCNAVCYELDFADTNPAVSASKLKKDAIWDVTGLPAGTYDVELYACAASTTLPQNVMADATTGRYQFRFGEGDYTNPVSKTYADLGLGTGEAANKCEWSNPFCQLTAAEGTARFEIHWTNNGYSCFIGAVRLVKVA